MTSGPVNVRFEHHPTGFGVGTATPRVSWELPGDAGVFRQTAYEVELTGPLGVESAVVGGQDQVLVPWPFAPLGSRQRGTVRVRVASDGAWTDWRAAAAVEAALLGPGDWTATFVTPKEIGAVGSPAPVLRRQFDVSGPVASARLYVSALGVYEAWLNGAGRRPDPGAGLDKLQPPAPLSNLRCNRALLTAKIRSTPSSATAGIAADYVAESATLTATG